MWLLLQVLRQGELRIFDEGETLLSRGFPHTQQVFILLRGHIAMHLADGRTFTAGMHVLRMLAYCSWPATHQWPHKQFSGGRICPFRLFVGLFGAQNLDLALGRVSWLEAATWLCRAGGGGVFVAAAAHGQ